MDSSILSVSFRHKIFSFFSHFSYKRYWQLYNIIVINDNEFF